MISGFLSSELYSDYLSFIFLSVFLVLTVRLGFLVLYYLVFLHAHHCVTVVYAVVQ